MLLKIYWDGEKEPSVDCPLVDFFCDPAGMRDEVNTALVNKRRGWNAYFPMPFRKSARVELVYDGPLAPGKKLWKPMPCYSYVMYRTLENVPDNAGYFHAYLASGNAAAGQARLRGPGGQRQGQVRRLERHRPPARRRRTIPSMKTRSSSSTARRRRPSSFRGWKIRSASVGDSRETQSQFPLTGYYPFFKGAAAYRFFVQDAISFEKSLRVAIGFGKHEDRSFRRAVQQAGKRAAIFQHGLLVSDGAARAAATAAARRRAGPAADVVPPSQGKSGARSVE